MFHTYALYNVFYLTKSLKDATPQTKLLNKERLVLAALSVPLNNKITNMERLPFHFVPDSIRQSAYTPSAREELLATARILQVEGVPSRGFLIQSINLESIHYHTNKNITELYNLIENESSPFVISKKGKAALEALCKEEPQYEMYRSCIERTLSVKIVQSCKTYYKNMKLSKLQNLLQFYSNINDVERLLFEFNREELVHTTISYTGQEGFLIFKPESQVAENLFNFGHQIHQIYKKVQESKDQSKAHRLRVFQKVKEKLDDETKEVQKQKEAMAEVQRQLLQQKIKEKEEQENQKKRDAERKQRE